MESANRARTSTRRRWWGASLAAATILTGIVGGEFSADAAGDQPLPEVTVGSGRVLVSERSEPKNWGVSGFLGGWGNGDKYGGLNSQVMAFAEIGDTIYVGGKFATVERFEPEATFDQPYLAAFDRETGEWIRDFRPEIGGVVWDLLPRPDGTLLVSGQFTDIGGQPGTTSLAVIDAETGAPVPGFEASITQNGEPGAAMTLEQVGDEVYVGGLFHRVTNANGVPRPVGRIARLDLTTGKLDDTWRPNFEGAVWDLAHHDDVMYVAGNITAVNGVRREGSARISTRSNTLLSGSHTPRLRAYQQTVVVENEKVYIGGSEHHLQVDTLDFDLLQQWSTGLGDFQAMTVANGYVYAGNHGSGTIVGGGQSLPYNFTVAINTDTNRLDRWVGAITSGFEGVWALHTDARDCVWAGGDFRATVRTDGIGVPAGSFARFCPPDRLAPSVPAAPYAIARADGVDLRWGASTDESAPITYEVYRNGTLIASGGELRHILDASGSSTDIYRVRAVDPHGNKSATTDAIHPAAPGEGASPVARIDVVDIDEGDRGSTIAFSSAASTDADGTIVGWYWEFGDGAVSQDQNPVHAYEAGGSLTVALTVFDDEGRVGRATRIVDVPGLAAHPGQPVYRYDPDTHEEVWSWEPTYDAATYTLHVDGVPFIETTTPEVATFLPPGRHTLTVSAVRSDGTQAPPSPATTVTTFAPVNYALGATASMSEPKSAGSTAHWAIDGIAPQTDPQTAFTASGLNPFVRVDLRRPLEFDTVVFHNGTTNVGYIDGSTLMLSDAPLPRNYVDALEQSTWRGHFPTNTGATETFHVADARSRYLEVTEHFGSVQVAELEVLHHARPPEIEGLTGDEPVAAAAVTDVDGATISFSSSGSFDPDGTIARYYWIFGDGTYSHSTEPVHEYLVGGEYEVTLIVADETGMLSTPQTVVIEVDGPQLTPGQPFVDRDATTWTWSWAAAPDATRYEIVSNGVVVASTTSTSHTFYPGEDVYDVFVRGIGTTGIAGVSPTTRVHSETRESLTAYGEIDATAASSDTTDAELVRDGDTTGSTAYVSALVSEPYLEVELPRIESLSSIELTNATTGAAQIAGARVLISDVPMPAALADAEIAALETFTIDSAFNGTLELDTEEIGARFVRVQLPGETRLRIAELAIFGVVYPRTVVYEVDAPSDPPVTVAATTSVTPTVSGAVVDFTAAASTDDGSIVDYFWHFEPGRFSRDESPTHEFTSAGYHNVRVTTVDNHGVATTIDHRIDVVPVEVPDGVSPLDPGVPVVTMPAGGLSAGTPATWSWTPALEVRRYDVLVDGALVATTTENSIELTLGAGRHEVAVRGVGRVGQVGEPTPAVAIELFASSDNVALGKPTRGTPGFSTTSHTGRAVDGDTSGVYPDMYVSNAPGAWLEIDLGAETAITSVRLWNRSVSQYRIVGSYILASSSPMSADLATARAEASAEVLVTESFDVDETFSLPATARYIRVHQPSEYLQLGEVEVFAATGAPRVTYPPEAGLTAPTVTIEVASRSGDAPTADVELVAHAAGADGAAIIGYEWDLGDGTTASGPSVSHRYEFARTHDVTVTAVDHHGVSATAELALKIAGPELSVSAPVYNIGADGSTWWSWPHAEDAVEYEVRVDGEAITTTDVARYEGNVPSGSAITIVGIATNGGRGDESSPVVYTSGDGTNAALGASVSATRAYGASWSAARAVDGNTDGSTAYVSATTGENQITVDLGGVQALETVVLWNRTGGSNRIIGAELLVSENPFPADNAAARDAADGVFAIDADFVSRAFDIGLNARYIRVQHSGQYLQVAEIQAFLKTTLEIDYGDTPPSAAPVPVIEMTGLVYGDGSNAFTLDGRGSTDDGAIREWNWVLPDGSTSDAAFVPLELAHGDYTVSLTVRDDHGQLTTTERVISVIPEPIDDQRPTYVKDLAGTVDGTTVTLTWSAATDNVGVTEYIVYRNGTELARTADTTIVLDDLPTGNSWLQLAATDAAGNIGGKTAPLLVTITAIDTEPPKYVKDLAGTVDGTTATLTWSAATDNVGVTEYIVYRNGTEYARTADTTTTLTDLPAGDNWIQLAATDAAGNIGGKTAPLLVTITAIDTEPPKYVKDLAGTVDGTTATLTWSAATDNVGVTEYVVYRNGTELTRTADTTIVLDDLPVGNSWIQLAATDAAGNIGGKTAPLLVTLG